MSRHHPYGGPYENARRGGSSIGPGPGPDRSHGRFYDRGGGPQRGRGRGRGNYNSYGGGYGHNANSSNYDSATPDSYSQWNGPQDSYSGSQNSGYGNDSSYIPNNENYGEYDQNFGSYEDGGVARGRGGRRGGIPRRERDDKVHDSLIEERIMRERPCRTLFIRNIKYETDSTDVRHKFEEHGEIKTFFDLIANRGMVFVTYYDLRAAERARERLQDTSISGRPIDVHYSLPRADDQNGKEPKDQNQGTLFVTLRNSQSGQPIDDNELRRKFQQFGDIKGIKPGFNPQIERVIEFFDTRACDEAFERMRYQVFQDGEIDVAYSADIPDVPLPPGPIPTRRPEFGNEDRSFGARNYDEQSPRGRRGGRGGRGRGGFGRDDWDRKDSWDGDGERAGYRDDFSRGRGRGRGRGGGGGYGDRFDTRPSGGYAPPPPGNFGSGHSGTLQPSGYGATNLTPPTNAPPGDDRVEQARKVQQLLAALKQPQNQGAHSPAAPAIPAPPSTLQGQMPPVGAGGPSPNRQFYPPPPASAMGQVYNHQYPGQQPPIPNMYGQHPAPPPSQTVPPASLAGLPPNVLAMLQQATQQPQGSQPSMPPYGMAMPPFPPGIAPTNGASTGGPDYAQLMSYIQNQAAGKRHQKVVLEVDFSGVLFGYTEITLVPVSRDLKTIYLHLRQCQITSVQVGNYTVQDWVHNDPLSNITSSDLVDCHKHLELKRKMYSAYAECDEGELAIPLPRQVVLKPGQGSTNPGNSFNAGTPEPVAYEQGGNQTATAEFAPILVRISYYLRNPVDGVQFIKPSDAYPYRVPHVYTTPSSPDAARCWVPCIDNLWEKCTWELEFVVPKSLEDDSTAMDVDGEDSGSEVGRHTVVVCSGELVEKIAHPNNPHKVIYLFSQTILTSVQHIAFAAGPFFVQAILAENAGISEDAAGSQTLMHAFCLPGYESLLSETTSFLRSAMNFYSTECGSYPFGSYKVVFVDELPTQSFGSATLTIASVDLLHGEDAIDAVFDSRQLLSHALAYQWVGINILPKSWSDLWLVNGLGLYVTGLFLRKLLGNNEYRFRLRKDIDRVLERDIGSMPPICQPSALEPPDSATLAFINLKAPLVLHILDRHLGKSGTALGLSRVLPKVFLSALSGEMPQNALSTHSFLRTCRKVSGVDLRSFVDQWIYGSGCPQFSFLATFNRKRMAVEIQMRQECPAFTHLQHDPVKMALLKPVPFFEGQMTVRIHEADGTPYEHVLDILAAVKRYEVPFNTKYKRVRRNTKRYLARQAAAQAAADGDTDAAEAIGMIDMGFGLEVWENEEERDRWKVADWTEEDEQAMAGSTYEWIRMDADFEWIARIQFEQADYMWVSQLQRDRDVVAQLEAVHALARSPTPIVSSTLTKTVLVTNYFFRVRCEAALALVTCASRHLDFLGLFHLFKLFLRYCYDSEDHDQDIFSRKYIPRPNDFSDFAEYFIRKSIINAIAQVRFENGKTPPIIRQFLLDQLRYNDNTVNPFSDAHYISSVIAALACATVSTSPPEHGELTKTDSKTEQGPEDIQSLQAAITEVERYRSMDRLIPSFHNLVTVAALEFHMVVGIAGMTPNDPKVFLTSTREGNANQVRLAGFDGLFMTKWYTPKIMSYVFAVIAYDPSRIIRRYVARNTFESLGILATIGEIKPLGKDAESLLIEEDGSVPEKFKDAKKTEIDLMIRAIRKDKEVGKSETLREFVLPLALDVNADYDVRWCMLKLADIAVRPDNEPLPKVTIHLPPTPVSEIPPTLPPTPVIKIMPKIRPFSNKAGSRKGSLVLPITSAPSMPETTTKLRLNTSTAIAAPLSTSINIPPPKTAMEPPSTVPQKPTHPPKKKERVVLKAQTAGMSSNDVKACRNALKKLVMNKHSAIFRMPVDPVRDKAPSYFEIIKNPMDLSTMGAKLQAGQYKDRSAFEADFKLMIQNCRTYNPSGTLYHNESIALETVFDKQWARIIKTVEAANKVALRDQVEPAEADLPPNTEPVKVKVSNGSNSSLKPVVLEEAASASASVPIKPATLLKLKIGSNSKPIVPVPEKPKAVAKPKAPPKPRKLKVADMPPPPYIDDGSHDLLQEVIAMEELERGDRVGPSSKPRKVTELDADEELLSLAADEPLHPPALKSPAPEYSVEAEKQSRPRHETPTRKETPKVKKAGSASGPSSRPGSAKGKEKEPTVPPPSVTPSKGKASSSPPAATPIHEKKCRDVLKNLAKVPQWIIFSRPVDPVLDGCPTYFDEIKHPMDFQTIKLRLDEHHYSTMEEFAADVELIFANCRQFNPPTTDPVVCADIVEKAFRKEWVKAMEKRLTFQEKRALLGLMSKLQAELYFFVFREPVDPVALGIPTYHDIIPKKDARDLRTIRSKVEADKYESLDAWEADMDLMVNNAILFNTAESEVGQVALALRSRVKEALVALRPNSNGGPQGKKRAAGVDLSKGGASGQGSATPKKIKLS